MRSGLMIIAVCASAVLAIDGCSLLDGDGSYSVADASSDAASLEAEAGNPIIHQSCPAAEDTNKCFLCEDLNCCDTYNACNVDPQCMAFRQCIQGCVADGGTGCDSTCAGQYVSGVFHWAQRDTCILVKCLDDCSTGAPDPCVKCSVTQCPEQYANLYGTVDGYLLTTCITACNDSNCENACKQQFPTAADALDAFAACVATFCSKC